MTTPTTGTTAVPTPVTDRALAPDLARGAMLLLIALAHAPWYAWTSEPGAVLLHAADGGLADRVAQIVTITAVDGRAWTLFGFLFAYGIGQMYARRVAGGGTDAGARALLRRRHRWLLAFGLVHAAVLWQGDILATYGVLGLLLVPLFLGRSDRTLAVGAGVLAGLGLLVAAGTAVLMQLTGATTPTAAPQQLALSTPGWLDTLPLRLVLWAGAAPGALFSFVMPAALLLGLLAARHRVLEEPERHLPLLRRTAVLGIAVGWAGGLATALLHVGVLALPDPGAAAQLHMVTGLAAALGYAAVFGLVAHRLRGRPAQPVAVRALVALGRRSLSGYLAQSLLFGPLLAAWGLGLGAYLTGASAALVAVAVWLTTVVAAHGMDRAGVRGPAETLLRRLTYRR
ncbi:DUF418 domain-containing protein [Pseudonocardia spirodelae]|uniref:DUF418 domain-containing protein n=1 Tax=Pseudonocardia spirodelae TaxID=3133431 RepID=A0ABU8TDT3_9PSEU